jgi:hypothetical protein
MTKITKYFLTHKKRPLKYQRKYILDKKITKNKREYPYDKYSHALLGAIMASLFKKFMLTHNVNDINYSI